MSGSATSSSTRAVDPGHAQLRGARVGARGVAADDRDDVDKTEAAHRIDVVGRHEAGPDQPHSDTTHQALLVGVANVTRFTAEFWHKSRHGGRDPCQASPRPGNAAAPNA